MKTSAAVIAALAFAIFFGGAARADVPAAPVGVTGIALDGQVELSWQPVLGADSYVVLRGTSASSTLTQLATTTGTTYDDATATNGTTWWYSVRAVTSAGQSLDSFLVRAAAQAHTCSGSNPVALENCLPGSAGWKLGSSPPPADAGGVEGFATASSINQGDSVDLKINSAPGTSVTAEIYRTGDYNGSGGRLISAVEGIPGVAQPACLAGPPLDCSNWSTSLTIKTSVAWTSGVYLVHLLRQDTGADGIVIFVVRNDSRPSGILYSVPMNTYEAYNPYGGKSLYTFNSSGGMPATKVSFNRPYSNPLTSLHDWYTRADFPFVSWLEHSGYDVTYGADNDLETSSAGNHGAYLIAPHSEYWSANMRSALESARAAGEDLFFAGSNAVYWKVRFENGGRTLVCYKAVGDPGGVTTRWRDPNGANQPENALIGQMYAGDNDAASYPLVVSANQGHDRIWRGIDSITTLAPGTSASTGSGLVGWEWDARFPNNGFEPAGLTVLASSPVTGGLTQTDGGQTTGNTTVNVTKYVAPSGALVFATGTNFWARGLALDGERAGEPVLAIQQATVNVLEDMGVPTPATPESNLRFGVAPPTPRPPAPTGVTAPTKTPGSISLSWPVVSGVDGYNVYRSNTPRSGGLPLGTQVNTALVTGTTFTDTGLTENSVYYYVVTSVKSGLETDASPQLETATASSGPTPTSARINVGGAAYTIPGTTTTFAEDLSNFFGGAVRGTASAIGGTANPALYQDERWGNFGYAIPIASGNYDVTFHFAETWFTTTPCAGQRIFSMDIVDTPGIDVSNLDICALVGPNTALTRTITNVPVTDGILNIQSIAGPADSPVLSALEVVPTGSGNGTGGTAGDGTGGPTVTATVPIAGASGLATNTPITATFSKPMNGLTINATTFTLKDSAGHTVTSNASYADATGATLTPVSP
ncbi:MAG: hypothetical protein QOI71_3708, partial [Gaiellales bacterium]|nr:hypothetical protein [Gaiellales bacterium]